MSDKKTENQDVGPDSDLPENEEELLSDVDAILSEEDPEFLETIGKISVNSAGLDEGIIGQALGLEEKKTSKILKSLSYPFDFKSNLKAVLAFWISVLIIAAGVYYTWNFSGGLLDRNLFMNSFAELGSEVHTYDVGNEVEAFYDNPRFAKNLVTMSSLHVNLRPSENSSSNPMLVFEITIEGVSSDAIVEIKDREAEFKDMLLRLTEEKTYDDLASPEGKQFMCDQFRDALNSVLTSGQVRRVMLKNFVIKS